MNDDIDDIVSAHRAETHAAPAHLKQQWHSAIDQAAALEHGRTSESRSTGPASGAFWGMAVAAALAVGIGLGVLLSDNPSPTVPDNRIAAVENPRAMPVAFSRGLQYHLRNSREQLTTYNAETDRTNLILDIIEQNRLFEDAADNNNAPKVARVLRAFEPILLRLAADDIAPEDAEALREQLAFELNVMLTKLARESSDESTTT